MTRSRSASFFLVHTFVARVWPRAGVRGSLTGALVVAVLLSICALPARAESPDEQPRPFESFEGVPGEWTEILNGYVYDPKTYGPRLIAIERESGGSLPPVFRMATADAYLRSGNRRAAERIFEQGLTQSLGYPWEDFANLGMGTIRLVSGDEGGAQVFFGRVTESQEGSSRALGSLGMGAALSAGGRFAEAQEAFAATAATTTVDEEVRQAGRFGNAMALYGAGDFEAAARAFDEIAKIDPGSPIARDAAYAAARARIALGDREGSAAALRELVDGCDPEAKSGRAPRALRNLDARAMGRNWLHNYRTTGWGALSGKGSSMYSIGGCALARSTLRALERNDATLTAVQPVAAPAAAARPAAAAPAKLPATAAPTPAPAPRSGWSPVLWVLAAVAGLVVLWRVVARGAKAP